MAEEPSFIFNIDPVIKLIVTLSTVSLICCFIIIYLYFDGALYESFSFTLMGCIAISEAISCIGHFLSLNLLGGNRKDKEDNLLCTMQRITVTFSDLCCINFILILSYSIYKKLKYNEDIISYTGRKVILSCGFLVPIIIGSLFTLWYSVNSGVKESNPLYYNFSPQCWLEGKDEIIAALFYAIYSVINIILVIIICKANNFLAKEIKNNKLNLNLIRETKSIVIKYMLIHLMYWIFAFIQRFIVYRLQIHEKTKILKNPTMIRINYILVYLYSIFMGVRGILFFLIFLENSKVKVIIKEKIEPLLTKYPFNFFFEQAYSERNSNMKISLINESFQSSENDEEDEKEE